MSIEEQGTTVDEIVDLLRETAEAHHTAYEETDGADPDWPIWYAGYLLEHGFNEMLNASILKSELVYLLITIDRERASDAPGSRWDHYYADFFATRYLW